jgi:hypothetical protein
LVPLYLYKLPSLSSCKLQRYIKNDIHIVHLILCFSGRKTTSRNLFFFRICDHRNVRTAVTCVQCIRPVVLGCAVPLGWCVWSGLVNGMLRLEHSRPILAVLTEPRGLPYAHRVRPNYSSSHSMLRGFAPAFRVVSSGNRSVPMHRMGG